MFFQNTPHHTTMHRMISCHTTPNDNHHMHFQTTINNQPNHLLETNKKARNIDIDNNSNKMASIEQRPWPFRLSWRRNAVRVDPNPVPYTRRIECIYKSVSQTLRQQHADLKKKKNGVRQKWVTPLQKNAF